MNRLLAPLSMALSLVAVSLAGAAFWQSGRTAAAAAERAETAAAETRAMAVRPLLVAEVGPAAGTGLGIGLSSAGAGPAVVRSVALALPAADGSLDWMAFPHEGNLNTMDLWAFLGLRAALAELPQDAPGPAVRVPLAGQVMPVGRVVDLIRFPATLPADWRDRNAARADRVLAGLMVCIGYEGLDGSSYSFDLRGLCNRPLTGADRRYLGEDGAAAATPPATEQPAP